jgi:hypothetical protein
MNGCGWDDARRRRRMRERLKRSKKKISWKRQLNSSVDSARAEGKN